MERLSKKLNKICSICSREISLTIYKDGTYRGWHYFGKIPLHTKKQINISLKAGTRKVKLGDRFVEVLKKDLKPYVFAEYWKCPKCYWNK